MTSKPETSNSEKTVGDVFMELTEEQADTINTLIECALNERSEEDIDKENLARVFDTLTEEQKTVVYGIIGRIVMENGQAKEEIQNEETSESQ